MRLNFNSDSNSTSQKLVKTQDMVQNSNYDKPLREIAQKFEQG